MNALFNKDEKWEQFFLRTVIVFGIILMLIVPIMQVQDEDAHTLRSVNLANLNLDYQKEYRVFQSVFTFIETYAEGNLIYIYENDKSFRTDHDLYWQSTKLPINTDQIVSMNDNNRTALYGNLGYLPQAIGILVGKIFELPIFWALILGRFAKLLAYATCCYWAIKLIPYKKDMMALLCLMPMPVFFAASLSPEGILVGTCYLFYAYLMHIKYEEKILDIKNVLILLLLAAFIFSVKMVYIIIVLVCFDIIKFRKTSINKYVIPALCVLTVLFAGYIMVRFWDTMAQILAKIPLTIYLYIKTYTEHFYYFLSLGIANFGTGYEPLNVTYVLLVAAFTVVVALQKNHENEIEAAAKCINVKTRILGVCLLLAMSVIVFMTMFMWTGIENANKNTQILGIQGRYFIPFIPMLFDAINNNFMDFKFIVKPTVIKIFSIVNLVVCVLWILTRYW